MARKPRETERAGDSRGANEGTRERVLSAAADLLAEQGRDALSTRAVATAAGIQAPTLYRLFGDKDGLLDAVAAYGFATYLADKRSLAPSGDPVEDIRRGWDAHVAFGLAQPAFYLLMYGEPGPGGSPAAQEADDLLRATMSRAAAAGRLTVTVERAAQLAIVAAVGLVLTLIATPADERDPELAAIVRETMLATIASGDESAASPPSEPLLVRQAIALREALRTEQSPLALSAAEQTMLTEWLERLAQR